MVKTQILKTKDIVSLLNAKIVTDNFEPEKKVSKGFSSDLMSDVLTLDTDNLLLITGLSNIQTIRTAEMADITTIVIVRNKKITDAMISLANENDITLLQCEYSLFKTTGILYNAGLEPIY